MGRGYSYNPLPPKPVHRPPPEWCDRLSRLPKKPVAPPRITPSVLELNGSVSEAHLKRMSNQASSRGLLASRSVPALVPPEKRVAHAGESQKFQPQELKLIIEVEHCIAHRPSRTLMGTSVQYVDAAERLGDGVTTIATELGCECELRVNPLLEVARTPKGTPDTPTAKLMGQRASAALLVAQKSSTLCDGYPRIGAFEVLFQLELRDSGKQIEAGQLFSKLRSRQWPNTSALVNTLKQCVENAELLIPRPPKVVGSAAPEQKRRQPPPLEPWCSAGRSAPPSRGGQPHIFAVFEALDPTELSKAARAAGLPEGQSKSEMVRSLIHNLRNPVVVPPPPPPQKKKRIRTVTKGMLAATRSSKAQADRAKAKLTTWVVRDEGEKYKGIPGLDGDIDEPLQDMISARDSLSREAARR